MLRVLGLGYFRLIATGYEATGIFVVVVVLVVVVPEMLRSRRLRRGQ